MCRLVDYLEMKADQGSFDFCTDFLHGFMKSIGKVLVIVVYCLTAFLTFTSFAIILPYEQLYRATGLIYFLYAIGSYFLINVVYHYHKARTVPPCPNPGKEGDRWCTKCEFWKSGNAHHCSICEKCVLGMDHHCIWINQCVGSHNHRHFFLFITFLSFALITIVLCGYNTAYDHIFAYADHNFCSSQLDLGFLQNALCEQGEMARNCVIFCYFISLLLLVLVGGLTLWNVYLISKGLTFIDYLKRDLRNRRPQSFRSNWSSFLGLRRNRTFFTHVLLPSSNAVSSYEGYHKLDPGDVI